MRFRIKEVAPANYLPIVNSASVQNFRVKLTGIESLRRSGLFQGFFVVLHVPKVHDGMQQYEVDQSSRSNFVTAICRGTGKPFGTLHSAA